MDFKNEKNVLINLYYKHGLSYDLKYGQPNWELPEETKIILTKPTYCSTYIFSFKKKKTDSFFFFIVLNCDLILLISSRE